MEIKFIDFLCDLMSSKTKRNNNPKFIWKKREREKERCEKKLCRSVSIIMCRKFQNDDGLPATVEPLPNAYTQCNQCVYRRFFVVKCKTVFRKHRFNLIISNLFKLLKSAQAVWCQLGDMKYLNHKMCTFRQRPPTYTWQKNSFKFTPLASNKYLNFIQEFNKIHNFNSTISITFSTLNVLYFFQKLSAILPHFFLHFNSILCSASSRLVLSVVFLCVPPALIHSPVSRFNTSGEKRKECFKK